MEIGKPNALLIQLVEVGCFQNGIAVTGQIAVSLVVGQNEDHVPRLDTFTFSRSGKFVGRSGLRKGGSKQTQGNEHGKGTPNE